MNNTKLTMTMARPAIVNIRAPKRSDSTPASGAATRNPTVNGIR